MFFTNINMKHLGVFYIIGLFCIIFSVNGLKSEDYATLLTLSSIGRGYEFNVENVNILQEHSEILSENQSSKYLKYSAEVTCKEHNENPLCGADLECQVWFELNHGIIQNNVTRCEKVPSSSEVASLVKGLESKSPVSEDEIYSSPSHETPITEDEIYPSLNHYCEGCEHDLNTDNEDLVKMAQTGLDSINNLHSFQEQPLNKPVKVTKAIRQVVNGVKYVLDVEWEPDHNQMAKKCTIEFFVQPWINNTPRVVHHNCLSENNNLDNNLLVNDNTDENTIFNSNEIEEEYSNRNRRDVNNNNNNQFLKDVPKEEYGEMRSMANYAMTTLDQIDVDDYKRIVLDIIDAKKELPMDSSGIMYYLIVRSVTVACDEIMTEPTPECLKEFISPIKICKLHLLRSFIHTDSPVNANVVKSECLPESEADLGHKRVRRVPQIIGGPASIDVNSDEVKMAANHALGVIVDGSSSENKLGIFRIVTATRQVVSGALYTIKMEVAKTNCKKVDPSANCKVDGSTAFKTDPDFNECEIKVWDQVWLNPRYKITKLKCSRKNANEVVKRRRRSSKDGAPESELDFEHKRVRRGLLGGHSSIDVNDEGVKMAANHALGVIADGSSSENKLGIFRIVSATRQVVAGFLYTIKMEVAKTNCKKDDHSEDCKVASSTALKDDPDFNECEIKIADSSWEKPRYKILSLKCSRKNTNEVSKRRRRSNKDGAPESEANLGHNIVFGGHTSIDLNDENLKMAANHALGVIADGSSSENKLGIFRIVSATQQVVSGVLYTIKIEVAKTNCKKDDHSGGCKVASSTALKDDPDFNECEIKVWDQVWVTPRYKVTSLKCSRKNTNEVSKRRRRSIKDGVPESEANLSHKNVRGGHKTLDVKDEDLKMAANHALGVIADGSSSENKLGIFKIVSATRQNVAGILYTMKIQVAKTDCKKDDPIDKECNIIESSAIESDADFNECELRIWDQPLHHRHYNVSALKCNKPNQNELDLFTDELNRSNKKSEVFEVTRRRQSSRSKRNTLPDNYGVVDKADIRNVNTRNVLEYIIEIINDGSTSKNELGLYKVLSATQMITNGITYKFKLQVAKTDCLKNDQTKHCKIINNGKEEMNECKIKIWYRRWLSGPEKYTLEYLQCTQPNTNEVYYQVLKRRRRSQRLIGIEDIGSEEQHGAEEQTAKPSRKSRVDLKTTAAFNAFLETHNKNYSSQHEYKKRLRIFRANLKKIAYLQETEQGTGIYGTTPFADLTSSEFKKKFLGLDTTLSKGKKFKHVSQAIIPNITLPKEFDWREHDAVTEVKNQGMCGSCWAFSTTGNIEGVYAVKNKELISLSEQELVDCDKVDNGCGGGYMWNAFEDIIDNLGGMESEEDYPYKGSNKKCHMKKADIKVQISSYVNVSRDETDMAKYLVENGPLSVAINANAMQFYFGGVSHPLKFLCKGGLQNLDHGVLIVGYGVHTTSIRHKIMPYWTIKNSWGTHWGEKGYYRLYRGDGSCGINDAVSSAVV